uniref:Uncharacterized protein n=1 Tax=Strongyloides stercoralis TaxID=6248 RepID=A0AAF5DPW9_STRER
YKQFTLKLNLINLIAYNNAVHTYRDNLYAYLPQHKPAYRKCKNEAKMIQSARIIKSSVYKTQFESLLAVLVICNKVMHTYRDNLYAHLPPHKMAYRKCKNETKMIQAARIINSSVYKTQFEIYLKTCFNLSKIKILIIVHTNRHNLYAHLPPHKMAYRKCKNEAKMIQAARIIKSSVYKTQFEKIQLNIRFNLKTCFNFVHTNRHNLYAHLPPHKLAYRKCKNEAKMIQAARIIKSSVYKTQFEFVVVHTNRHNLYAHLPQHKPAYRKCKNEAKMIQAARIIKSSVYKTQFEMLNFFVKYKL